MKNTGSPPSEFPVDDGCRFASMSTPPSLRSSVEVEVEVEGDEFDGADGGGSNIVMSRGVSEKAGVNEGSLSSLPMLSSVQGNSPGDESLRVSGSTTGSGISECLYDPMDPGVISASISELEKNQRLSDSTIALVSKMIASQVPSSDSRFKILDPLWLQVDAGVTPRNFPFKAKAVPQQVLVPLHHLRPEHCTLAHGNFITQRVRYFDSLWDNARFQQVSQHLMGLLIKRCGPLVFQFEPTVGCPSPLTVNCPYSLWNRDANDIYIERPTAS